MEEVVGKMQTGHKTMVQNMIDDFKQCSPPPKVLQPLQAVLDDAARRGHAFFNVRASPPPPHATARVPTERGTPPPRQVSTLFQTATEQGSWFEMGSTPCLRTAPHLPPWTI